MLKEILLLSLFFSSVAYAEKSYEQRVEDAAIENEKLSRAYNTKMFTYIVGGYFLGIMSENIYSSGPKDQLLFKVAMQALENLGNFSFVYGLYQWAFNKPKKFVANVKA